MKNIKSIFYVSLVALFMMSLAACNDEEVYDFPGDPYNRVYMSDKSYSYKIVQTPISTVSNLKFETILKCTQKASANVKATVEVDNSLIAAYNEKNGTNYEAMPAAALVIENTTMNIPSGTMATTDTLRITITEDKSVLASLRSQNGYLIPLRLTATEGGESQPSSNLFSTYLIVTITEDNVNHDAAESDITGTLVADQTGWSATTNGAVYSWYDPIETLFDGDMSTICYISNSDGELRLDINMGKAYTFDAITLYYGYYGYKYGSLSSGMTIYTSNDGTTWQSAGEITGATSNYCVFYAPITAQYIRLVEPKDSYYMTTIWAGIFNVYAK